MIIEILALISILYVGFGSIGLVGYLTKKNLKGWLIPIILILSTITILVLLRGGNC